jgi:hypothetical protein
MDMSEHSIKDLGTFMGMFAEAGYYKMARSYLNEMAERLGAMEALKGESVAAMLVRQTQQNDLLAELPLVETKEPVLKYEPIATEAKLEEGIRGKEIMEKWESDGRESREPSPIVINNTAPAPAPEPEPEGLVRDEQGKVTHLSTQPGRRGFDPDIHENTELKIFCNGSYIETAIAADTVEGTVWYYKKNDQGRIKTLTVHGTVEIKGLN